MFTIKRGMVLRTTRVINMKLEDGSTFKLPSGSRVKAMSTTEKGLKFKVKDKTLPDNVQGEHVESGWSNVKQVERGRPETSEPAAEGGKKATTKGKGGAKKSAGGKKTAAKTGGKKGKAEVETMTIELEDEDEPTPEELEDEELGELIDVE